MVKIINFERWRNNYILLQNSRSGFFFFFYCCLLLYFVHYWHSVGYTHERFYRDTGHYANDVLFAGLPLRNSIIIVRYKHFWRTKLSRMARNRKTACRCRLEKQSIYMHVHISLVYGSEKVLKIFISRYVVIEEDSF